MKWILLGVVIMAGTVSAAAQDKEPKPLYHDLSSGQSKKVVELYNKTLSIQYHDRLGTAATLPIRIYNWKNELVADLALEKSAGLNHFNVELASVGAQWNLKELYLCEATDEQRNKYSFSFRLLEKPENEIIASIFVSPRQLKCKNPTSNLVEFYGQISGGKPPYTTNWYVLNDYRREFLYQPKTETIDRPGKTSMVQVDKTPDYFVIFVVKDACGNEQYQVVNLVCEKGKKKINTVFFESMQDFKSKTKLQSIR